MAPGRKYAFVDVISVPFAIAAVERPLYCSERAYQCRRANVSNGRGAGSGSCAHNDSSSAIADIGATMSVR